MVEVTPFLASSALSNMLGQEHTSHQSLCDEQDKNPFGASDEFVQRTTEVEISDDSQSQEELHNDTLLLT